MSDVLTLETIRQLRELWAARERRDGTVDWWYGELNRMLVSGPYLPALLDLAEQRLRAEVTRIPKPTLEELEALTDQIYRERKNPPVPPSMDAASVGGVTIESRLVVARRYLTDYPFVHSHLLTPEQIATVKVTEIRGECFEVMTADGRHRFRFSPSSQAPDEWNMGYTPSMDAGISDADDPGSIRLPFTEVNGSGPLVIGLATADADPPTIVGGES